MSVWAPKRYDKLYLVCFIGCTRRLHQVQVRVVVDGAERSVLACR